LATGSGLQSPLCEPAFPCCSTMHENGGHHQKRQRHFRARAFRKPRGARCKHRVPISSYCGFSQSSFLGKFTDGQVLHTTFAVTNSKPSEMVRILVEGYGESVKAGRVGRPSFHDHMAGPWYINVLVGTMEDEDLRIGSSCAGLSTDYDNFIQVDS
jgi:hypothetical protein